MFLLFLKFVKFGILCFGGGYMIIPLLYDEYVVKTQYFSIEEFGNLLSVSQLTPGAVSVNTATYVGFWGNSFLGAVFATLGLIFPTVLIALTVLTIMKKYKDSVFFKGIIQGGKFVSVVMLGYAAFLFLKMSVFSVKENDVLAFNWFCFVLFVLSALLSLRTKIPMIGILLFALISGLCGGFLVQIL